MNTFPQPENGREEQKEAKFVPFPEQMLTPYDVNGNSHLPASNIIPKSTDTLTPLTRAGNNPAPRFPKGTMWKVDGKGGYIQVKVGEQLTSTTYISNGGQLVPLTHPDNEHEFLRAERLREKNDTSLRWRVRNVVDVVLFGERGWRYYIGGKNSKKKAA